MTTWKINLSGGTSLNLFLDNTPAGDTLASMLKHLQHVPVPFSDLDNPYNRKSFDLDSYITEVAKLVNVDIDKTKLTESQYLNYLHKVYEERYDGGSDWLKLHEAIHIIEARNFDLKFLYTRIDWRNKAGKIIKPMTAEIQKCSVQKVLKGQAVICYGELGKTLYHYWRDKEPDDLKRIKQLCTPWVQYKPNIKLVLEDFDLKPKDWDDFLKWGNQINDKYWSSFNLPVRDLSWQQSVILVGKIDNVELLTEKLKNGESIVSVKFSN